MSRLKTKQAFITHLLANLPTGITADDVAFENQQPAFKPNNKALWLDTHIIEASSEMMGKSDTDSNEGRGFFQIDVNVPITSDNYDNILLSTVDELATSFRYNTKMVYNAQTISTLDNDSPDSKENGAWYRRMITINYLTFSTR